MASTHNFGFLRRDLRPTNKDLNPGSVADQWPIKYC